MKASPKLVLIADSLCYDDPSIYVNSVKEYVFFFLS